MQRPLPGWLQACSVAWASFTSASLRLNLGCFSVPPDREHSYFGGRVVPYCVCKTLRLVETLSDSVTPLIVILIAW